MARKKQKQTLKETIVVLLVLALPFLGGGTLMLAFGIQKCMKFGFKGEPLYLTLCGIPFVVVGIFLGRAAISAYREKPPESDEKWLQTPEWAAGKGIPEHAAKLNALWFATLVWNGISIPAALATFDKIKQGDLLVLMVWFFPLIGAFLLVSVIHKTLQAAKYRGTDLHLYTLPGIPGGRLVAEVFSPINLGHARIRVKLACVNRYSTTRRCHRGANAQTEQHTDSIWEEEYALDGAEAEPSGRGWVIPVAFALPADSSETQNTEFEGIQWLASIQAAVTGIDFDAEFRVPVFAVNEEEAEAINDAAGRAMQESPALQNLAARQIHEEHTAEGQAKRDEEIARRVMKNQRMQLSIRGDAVVMGLPPFRSVKAIVGWALFALIFTSITVYMFQQAQKGETMLYLFVAVFGFFAAILNLAVLWKMVGAKRITVDSHSVVVETSILHLIKWSRATSVGEIKSIEVDKSGSAGETEYFNIDMNLDTSKKTLLTWIEGRSDAEWLAGFNKRVLGL
ncbi:MAG: hypothetical protein QF473_11800 [Planctomycetota bacterium]|jgi:hypothetical protein|nr:hypothetical protein [Planctomycetota bacterium]